MQPSKISIDHLPPFGLINEDNEAFLRTRPVPERFNAPGRAATKDKSSADVWDTWVDDRATEMSNFLWPTYDSATQNWVGAARDQALLLTEIDLGLLKQLQSHMDTRILGKADGKHRPTVTHLDLFRPEDEPVPPRVTFSAYDDKFLTSLNCAEWDRAVILGGRSIARPASQALKKRLQRPRPMQTALMFGINDLKVHRSVTAVSPAMIGGHCIQGMMALAELENSMADVFTEDITLQEDVRRYFIDTGDRRVYAGLHHPSDNIGSWWVGFKLCDHVFSNALRIREQLWSAIRQHSTVYRMMLEHTAKNNGSPYAALLAELERAATHSNQSS
jgi:hypothetical protein